MTHNKLTDVQMRGSNWSSAIKITKSTQHKPAVSSCMNTNTASNKQNKISTVFKLDEIRRGGGKLEPSRY